ncbi:MAG: hypothetical protein QXJ17_08335 [Nitrososphaeria archaeon]
MTTHRSEINLKDFVTMYGRPFSEALGIDLKSGKNGEILKWFLASILYSKPIRESSATRTYSSFLRHKATTPKEILRIGWHGLVNILDEGSYTRYDFSTADKLLEVFGNLQKDYEGDLNKLHQLSENSSALEENIKRLGKGIGDTTVSIFLREMRHIWPKSDPKPSKLVKIAMEDLGIEDLKRLAESEGMDLVRLETALLRYAKDFLRKGKRLYIKLKS